MITYRGPSPAHPNVWNIWDHQPARTSNLLRIHVLLWCWSCAYPVYPSSDIPLQSWPLASTLVLRPTRSWAIGLLQPPFHSGLVLTLGTRKSPGLSPFITHWTCHFPASAIAWDEPSFWEPHLSDPTVQCLQWHSPLVVPFLAAPSLASRTAPGRLAKNMRSMDTMDAVEDLEELPIFHCKIAGFLQIFLQIFP